MASTKLAPPEAGSPSIRDQSRRYHFLSDSLNRVASKLIPLNAGSSALCLLGVFAPWWRI